MIRPRGLMPLLVLAVLVLGLIAGCSNSSPAANNNPQPTPSPSPQPSPQPSPSPSPSPAPSPTPTAATDLVYVTNQLSSSISGFTYSAGANSASSTPGSPYTTDFGPGPILTNSTGTLVFAVMEQEAPTERGSNCFNAPAEVISYSVDASTGALTLVQRLNMQKFCEYGAAIHGSTLYLLGKDQGSDNWLEVVTFDSSGNMTETSGSPFDLGSGGLDLFKLAIAPDGNHLFITNRNYTQNQGVPGLLVFQRNPDGSWGTSSTITVPDQWDVALTPDGRSMMTTSLNDGTVTTYSVDPATGTVTSHAHSSMDHPSRVVADPTGRFFAVVAATGLWVYSVDTNGNIAVVPGAPFDSSTTYVSAAFDSKGMYLTAVGGSANIFSVDQQTGALSKVAGPLSLEQYPNDVVMLTK